MPDLVAPPRNEWLGGLSDALARAKQVLQSYAPQGSLLSNALGQAPEALSRVASGFKAPTPIQETGPDPSLAAKYGPVADVAGLLPTGPLGKISAVAGSLSKLGLIGTILDRSHLVQLAKTDPEMVQVLEKARKASLKEYKSSGDLNEAWKAGSAHLEGTPYAGWLPAQGGYPAMFEVSDAGARLAPRFDPAGVAHQPGLAPVSTNLSSTAGPLGASYSHPELEKFLPDMPRWEAEILQSPGSPIGGEGGFNYGPERQRAGLPPLVESNAADPGTTMTNLIHEGQHGAAAFGNLPPGTNPGYESKKLDAMYPKMPMMELIRRGELNYLNDPGEMLARVAENRRFLGGQDLRAKSPLSELEAQYTPTQPITWPTAAEMAAGDDFTQASIRPSAPAAQAPAVSPLSQWLLSQLPRQ